MAREQIASAYVAPFHLDDLRDFQMPYAKNRDELGVAPREDFALGLEELAEWVACQSASDHVPDARRELEIRGLVA